MRRSRADRAPIEERPNSRGWHPPDRYPLKESKLWAERT